MRAGRIRDDAKDAAPFEAEGRNGIERECGPGAKIHRHKGQIVAPEKSENRAENQRDREQQRPQPRALVGELVDLAGAAIIGAVRHVIDEADIRGARHDRTH